VVQGTTSTSKSSSSTSMSDSNLTATITPTSATSKILVLVSQNSCGKTSGNANNAISLQLLRGATVIQVIAASEFYTGTAIQLNGSIQSNYLDDPATTSATTYKTQIANYNASAEVFANDGSVGGNSVKSTITLIEIGA